MKKLSAIVLALSLVGGRCQAARPPNKALLVALSAARLIGQAIGGNTESTLIGAAVGGSCRRVDRQIAGTPGLLPLSRRRTAASMRPAARNSPHLKA